MTHTFDEIIRLDSERTQGRWEFHDGGRKNDWSESSWVQIPEHFDDNGNDSDDVIYLRLTANAQYIAAMPDAVGLLKKYRERLIENQWVFKALVEDYKKAGNEISAGLMQERIKQIDELLQEPKP